MIWASSLGDGASARSFGDLNNDGTLDLYLTNGYVSLARDRSYWYDFAKVAGGNASIIGDADHWPAVDGRKPLRLSAEARLAETMAQASSSMSLRAVGVTDTF